METLQTKSEKNGRKRILRSYVLLFSFMAFFIIGTVGQALGANNSTPTTKNDNNATLAQAQKDAEHQSTMNYIYMAVGLVVIFGIAGFTTLGKKKNSGPEGNEKNHVITHHHSSNEKRYGGHRSSLRHN